MTCHESSSAIASTPMLCPCYCANCKRPLSDQSLVTCDTAWCPDCESAVTTSAFSIPAWTIATLLLLVSRLLTIT